jgi:structural maintenance of chromosome 4
MLFVFGKRAKKLRLNKVSELIHKSDAVKDDPPSAARVSVFFQEIIDTGEGDQDYIIVPDSGIEVTRIARKDSSSTYKLDGKTCQFKVVSAYLASKGIDLDNNRFLILQGEVEMISMMAPKGKNENDEGLLEYLEDIIGSSKYVEETTTVAEKVEALTDLRQEKLNRVKAVEKEKDALESAKLEAEALLGKEREIRRKQNILYQIHAMKAEQEAEHYTGKKTKAEQVLQAERERLENANERVHEIESGLSEQRKEYEKIHDELKQTKEEFAAYERRDIKLREELKHGKTQKKKLETKAKTETKKEEDAVAKGEAAEESIPEFEQKIQELVELNAEEDGKLEQIYEDMKGVTQKLRSELEQKTQELAPVNQERACFQADLDTAETEVKLLEDSTTRAKKNLGAAEEELATLDHKQESKSSELKAGEDELTQAKARIVDAQADEKVLAEKEGSISKRNQQLLVSRCSFSCLDAIRRLSIPLLTHCESCSLLLRLDPKRQRLPCSQREAVVLRPSRESSRLPRKAASSATLGYSDV